ncbi:HEAT repeat domain-containing protein [candidate division WOR-3 bacterium]|nr:HEAT repeat domain-containing protein [candidate division WOR-3 bacterium]
MKKLVLCFILFILTCGVPPLQEAHLILQNGIKDESLIIRINAAKGYAFIGETQGIQMLYEALKGEDKNGIVAALSALYDLKETRYSPIFGQLAVHTDPLIRAEAYNVIAHINAPECYLLLKQGIQDKVAKIRKYSYSGLAKFNDPKTILSGLHDNDALVKIAAAQAMGTLGEDQASNVIRGVMQTVNAEIWHDGILALAEIGDTSAIPFIKEQLGDTPWETRLAAAEALIMLGQGGVINVLKEGAASNNPFVRVGTIVVIKEHGFVEAKALLETAVHDDYINVSILAIEALAKYWPKEHALLFVEMMKAPNPLVKIAAASAYIRSQ